jgi:hypothetical protein
MSCQLVYESDLIERYVRAEGTRGERETFERHCFECQACYESVRACRLLRAELRPDDAAGEGRPRRDRFGRRAAPYEELRLRGPADDATRAFREAMARYAAADYAGASRGLERASRLDPQAPDPLFYPGICRLMLGDAPAAVRDLQRAVRISDPASADEARRLLGVLERIVAPGR